MKVLRLLWRILVVLFQEAKILWKRYQSYRALKSQQQTAPEPESVDARVETEADQALTSGPKVLPKSSPAKSSPAESSLVESSLVESSLVESSFVESSSAESVTSVQTNILLTDVEPAIEPAEELAIAWTPPGTTVQIQGVLVADGFVYVGQPRSNSAGADSVETLPNVIDPRLEIKHPTPAKRQSILAIDWADHDALSYGTLSPEMRAIFLGWLATGRKERDISISALRLFLWGIERRVVELLSGDRTVDELLALILELERLEVQYAHQITINPHIQGLIECCQVQLALSCQPETLLALLPVEQKLSTGLKVALGQCIRASKPIPMTLLWAWYQSSAVAVDLKTPAKRCEREFNFLIQRRGEQRGFSIETGAYPSLLPVVYQPFGPSVGEGNTPIPVVDTIDMTSLEPQLTALEPLIEACTQDLDAYSRLIGRSPEAEGTPTAVALLPQELVFLSGNDQVKAIQDWCHQRLKTENFVTCSGIDLINLWPTTTSDKIRKKEAELLGVLLAKFGFGYVPDVRYGQATVNAKHPIILFRLEQMGDEIPSIDYPMALMALELTQFFEPLEGEMLQTPPIESFFDLTDSERSRLVAVELWHALRPLTWKQLCKRVKKLTEEQKSRLAIAIHSFLEQDWQLEDTKYFDLQSLIPLPQRVLADMDTNDSVQEDGISPVPETSVSEMSVPETSVPETSVSEMSVPETSVPETLMPAAPVFVLDSQLIAQRSEESQVASGLLSDIFEEEEPATSPNSDSMLPERVVSSTTVTGESSSSALGLDEFHWHLLRELGQRESWERAELEAIAQNQGLLLDGALENINEVAFDHCDEALTEGDDPIEVNDWVYEELKAA